MCPLLWLDIQPIVNIFRYVFIFDGYILTPEDNHSLKFTAKLWCSGGLNYVILFIAVMENAETWTLRKINQKYLESFKIWCWKRMEKISWTDRV
jgi:hypothetical protein